MVPASTSSLIEVRLASLSVSNRVDILFACESGSRAWGFPSPDSDFDVRFIYIHPLSWYLSVEEGSDVIEMPLEETSGGLLDLGGWDLRKALRLARKSNPVVWEWLQSPIVYRALADQTLREMREILDPFYSPVAACRHYLGLCRATMERAFSNDSVVIKKYFYMLRPLLAALWIENQLSVPPMEFDKLLAILDWQPVTQANILELLKRKRYMDESVPIPRIPILDDFIHQELNRLKVASLSLPIAKGDVSRLDGLLYRFLKPRCKIS